MSVKSGSSKSNSDSGSPFLGDRASSNAQDIFAHLIHARDKISMPTTASDSDSASTTAARGQATGFHIRHPSLSSSLSSPLKEKKPRPPLSSTQLQSSSSTSSNAAGPSSRPIPYTHQAKLVQRSHNFSSTQNIGNGNGKGKCKATEPIDLTLSDTDDELAPTPSTIPRSEMFNSRYNDSSSTGSVVALDSDLKPIVSNTKKKKLGSRRKDRDKKKDPRKLGRTGSGSGVLGKEGGINSRAEWTTIRQPYLNSSQSSIAIANASAGTYATGSGSGSGLGYSDHPNAVVGSSSLRPTSPNKDQPLFLRKPRHPTQGSKSRSISPVKPNPPIKTSASQQSPPHVSQISRYSTPLLDNNQIPLHSTSASSSKATLLPSRSDATVPRPQTPVANTPNRSQASPANSPATKLSSHSKKRINSKDWAEALKLRTAEDRAKDQSQTPSVEPSPRKSQRSGPVAGIGIRIERVRSSASSSSSSEPGMRTALNSGLAPLGFGRGGDSKVKRESPLKRSVPLPIQSESESEPEPETDEQIQYEDSLPPLVKASPSPARKPFSSNKQSKAASKSTSSSPMTNLTSTPVHRPFSTQSSASHSNPNSIEHKRISRMAEQDEESYRPKSSQSHTKTKRPPLPPHVSTLASRDRPTRVRPEPGAYTLPTPETRIEDWPVLESTHAAGGSKKRNSTARQDQDKGKGKECASIQKVGPSNPTKEKGQITRVNEVQSPATAKKSSQLANTAGAIALQRTMSGSTTSTLTPPPSPTQSQGRSLSPVGEIIVQRKSLDQNQKPKSHNVSPTKSLSATPAKALFPQLLPEIENPSPSKRESITKANSEEQEVIETKEQEPDADDILAEFEDYDWGESDGEGGDEAQQGVADQVEGANSQSLGSAENQILEAKSSGTAPVDSAHTPTPSNIALPHKISPSKVSTPLKNVSSPTQGHPNPKTPRSSQKRLRPSSTSVSPANYKRHLSADHWDKLLKEEEELRDKERDAARKKAEAMQLDLDMIAETGADRNEQGDPDNTGDVSAFLNDLANASPHKPLPSPSPKKPSMLSAVASRAASRQEQAASAALAKKEARADALRAAQRAEDLRQRRKADRTFNALMSNAKQSEDIEAALMDISHGDDLAFDLSDPDAEDAYPTPRSETGSAHDADGTMDLTRLLQDEDDMIERETELEQMIERARGEGMVIDADLVRDAKTVKTKRIEGLRWEGFWQQDFESSKGGDPVIRPDLQSEDHEIWNIAMQAIDKQDLQTLSVVVDSPAFECIGSVEVALWLFTNALQSGHPSWTRTAQEAFIDLLHSPINPSLLPWHDFESDLLKMLSASGARLPILSGHPHWRVNHADWPCGGAGPEEACAFVCRVISLNVKLAGPQHRFSAAGWIPILLLLAVDEATSFSLRKVIFETIRHLLSQAVRKDHQESARLLAQAIAKATGNYGDDVRAAVLESLGQRTHEARDVNRWLGMEYLTSGILTEVMSMDNPPKVPTVSQILDVLTAFHAAVKPVTGEPDFTNLNYRVTFLYAALSDFGALLEQHPIDVENGAAGDKGGKDLLADSELDQIRTWVRLCRDRIADQSDGSERGTVKARLHQLYEFSSLLLLVEIKKKIRSKRAGKGYKFGNQKGGQTKLDFGTKERAGALR
ncbi:hypothetical protein IAT40_002987 [Kwoniella sp. CBS 6097]